MGANIDSSKDRIPLNYAARFSNPNTSEILVLNNANIDFLDSENCTPLVYAAR